MNLQGQRWTDGNPGKPNHGHAQMCARDELDLSWLVTLRRCSVPTPGAALLSTAQRSPNPIQHEDPDPVRRLVVSERQRSPSHPQMCAGHQMSRRRPAAVCQAPSLPCVAIENGKAPNGREGEAMTVIDLQNQREARRRRRV
jgi:hypothetical protein